MQYLNILKKHFLILISTIVCFNVVTSDGECLKHSKQRNTNNKIEKNKRTKQPVFIEMQDLPPIGKEIPNITNNKQQQLPVSSKNVNSQYKEETTSKPGNNQNNKVDVGTQYEDPKYITNQNIVSSNIRNNTVTLSDPTISKQNKTTSIHQSTPTIDSTPSINQLVPTRTDVFSIPELSVHTTHPTSKQVNTPIQNGTVPTPPPPPSAVPTTPTVNTSNDSVKQGISLQYELEQKKNLLDKLRKAKLNQHISKQVNTPIQNGTVPTPQSPSSAVPTTPAVNTSNNENNNNTTQVKNETGQEKARSRRKQLKQGLRQQRNNNSGNMKKVVNSNNEIKPISMEEQIRLGAEKRKKKLQEKGLQYFTVQHNKNSSNTTQVKHETQQEKMLKLQIQLRLKQKQLGLDPLQQYNNDSEDENTIEEDDGWSNDSTSDNISTSDESIKDENKSLNNTVNTNNNTFNSENKNSKQLILYGQNFNNNGDTNNNTLNAKGKVQKQLGQNPKKTTEELLREREIFQRNQRKLESDVIRDRRNKLNLHEDDN